MLAGRVTCQQSIESDPIDRKSPSDYKIPIESDPIDLSGTFGKAKRARRGMVVFPWFF